MSPRGEGEVSVATLSQRLDCPLYKSVSARIPISSLFQFRFIMLPEGEIVLLTEPSTVIPTPLGPPSPWYSRFSRSFCTISNFNNTRKEGQWRNKILAGTPVHRLALKRLKRCNNLRNANHRRKGILCHSSNRDTGDPVCIRYG